MKKLSAKKYAILLYEALDGKKKEDIPQVIGNFLKLLRKSNQFRLADKILEEYQKYWNKRNNIEEIEVITAHPLPAKESLANKISRKIEKKVLLRERLDEKIIGGIIIKHDDILINACYQNKLNKLREELRK